MLFDQRSFSLLHFIIQEALLLLSHLSVPLFPLFLFFFNEDLPALLCAPPISHWKYIQKCYLNLIAADCQARLGVKLGHFAGCTNFPPHFHAFISAVDQAPS